MQWGYFDNSYSVANKSLSSNIDGTVGDSVNDNAFLFASESTYVVKTSNGMSVGSSPSTPFSQTIIDKNQEDENLLGDNIDDKSSEFICLADQNFTRVGDDLEAGQRIKLLDTDFVNKSELVYSDDSNVHIALSLTEADQHIFKGLISLVLYIGLWIFSSLLSLFTVITFILGYYFIGSILLVSILLCYILPLKPSSKVRRFCRMSLAQYFKSISIIFEHVPRENIDLPTILCVCPHGIFSLCWANCYLTEELHHFQWCFSTLLNLSPFLRIITRLTGHPSSVRKSNIIRLMEARKSIAIIPGGWHEATIHHHDRDRIYIRKRRGFIKYAMHYGYTVTPSYGFGERSTYRNVQGCYKFRFWLNNYGILTILPWGSLWCPLFPKPVSLHIVVGKPVHIPHIPNPTPKDVAAGHRMYIEALHHLFERHKYRYYGEDAADRHLEFW